MPQATSPRPPDTSDPSEDPTTADHQTSGGRPVVGAIREAVEPIVVAHHCELVALEHRRESVGWVLRLYVERVGHDPRNKIGGVTLDECARISRDVGVALDVAEIIHYAYHLEVSSPGLERPLSKASDAQRFRGLRAKLQLVRDLPDHPKRKVLRGTLDGVEGEQVMFEEDYVGRLIVPWDAIARGHLLHEEEPRPKPGHAKGRTRSRHAERPGRDHDRSGPTSPESSSPETTSAPPSSMAAAPPPTKERR